jgi:hypothetical protein
MVMACALYVEEFVILFRIVGADVIVELHAKKTRIMAAALAIPVDQLRLWRSFSQESWAVPPADVRGVN